MSALGHKRTFRSAIAMSTLPPKADIGDHVSAQRIEVIPRPSTHPILGDELRALRRLKREQEPRSPFVFTSERGAPFSTAGFARMVERAWAEAKLAFKAHPHMLRHACDYAPANKGHEGATGLPRPPQHSAHSEIH